MDTGKLKHRCTIQRATASRSDTGQVLSTWSTHLTRWGCVKPLNTRELLAAQQIHTEITTEIWLRFPVDVTAKDRIVFDSRTFEILGKINVDEAKHWVKLLCKERE